MQIQDDEVSRPNPTNPTRTINPLKFLHIERGARKSLVSRGIGYEEYNSTNIEYYLDDLPKDRIKLVTNYQTLLSQLGPENLLNTYGQTPKEIEEALKYIPRIKNQLDYIWELAKIRRAVTVDVHGMKSTTFTEPAPFFCRNHCQQNTWFR